MMSTITFGHPQPVIDFLFRGSWPIATDSCINKFGGFPSSFVLPATVPKREFPHDNVIVQDDRFAVHSSSDQLVNQFHLFILF